MEGTSVDKDNEATKPEALKSEEQDGTQSTVDEDLHAVADVELGEPSVAAACPLTASNRSEGRGRTSQVESTTTRSVSFDSPKASTSRPTLAMPLSLSSHTSRRRMHDVDGRPLDHWDKKNFEKKRDETCRVVYEPKDGKEFFQKNLPMEDYEVIKSISLEQPYYSKYNRFFPKRGHFCCKACGNALYAAIMKFDAEDGWPAFGFCVEGAIGLIPSEKRKAEIEREDQACIKLQAFFRGVLCRMRVTKMLEDMIKELLEEKKAKARSQTDQPNEPTENETAILNFQVKSPLFSPTTIKKKIGKTKGLRYTLLRALGDDYTEIHCHRCKSHLGDVLEDDNIGRNGRMFQERHRVNGRALKYVEDDLPKRINIESSLLFADRAKRRMLGLPSPKKKAAPEIPLRSVPFVSPRAQRKKLMDASGIVSDPLSVSCHASVQGNGKSVLTHLAPAVTKKRVPPSMTGRQEEWVKYVESILLKSERHWSSSSYQNQRIEYEVGWLKGCLTQ
ncbi:MAG: hypothetical protein SGILL_007341 [Bacillariaceae sp.]